MAEQQQEAVTLTDEEVTERLRAVKVPGLTVAADEKGEVSKAKPKKRAATKKAAAKK